MTENVSNSFPSNNHKAREAATEKSAKPEKKVEKVATSSVGTRKKGLGRRIAETFTGDDARNVGNYVLFDVIVPATKSMISDAVSQGVERTLFGDVRRRTNGGPRVNGYTNYNRMSGQSSSTGSSMRAMEADGPRRTMSRQARASHDFDEIILETRGDAEIVIEKLRDMLSAYDVATVADLYDLVGITGSFTDNKWGWYNLRDARVSSVRGGYLLDLPGTTAID